MAIKRMAAAVLAALMCLCGMSAFASAEELPVFGSMKDLMAYLYCDCACMLQEEIAFCYTGELDDVFASPDALRYMMRNCGLIQWDQARNTEKRRVRMDNIVYAPGFRIAQAWRMGRTDDLTDEEREVFDIAQGMVREAEENASSPFGVLVNLHDALLERVSYAGTTADGVSAEDTAVGALKYGGAECDGYTDAFYLLAALAGHQAGYLRGRRRGRTHLERGALEREVVSCGPSVGRHGYRRVSRDDDVPQLHAGRVHERYACLGTGVFAV